MRYAFMTFSAPTLDLSELLALAGRLGYDGIEPRLDRGHAHGVEVAAGRGRREAVRDSFRRSGIAPACLATSCRFADPSSRLAMVADAHARIDLAGDVGCRRLRVFGGAFPESVSRERAADSLVAGLADLADHAAERDVTLCLETHDAWCDPRRVAEVLARVDHPRAAANWDVLHPVRTRSASIDESFELLRPRLAHLHVHDARLADPDAAPLAPIGTGDVDHRRVIERLRSIDYDGFLSGEWIDWEPADVHLPRELAALKACETAAGGP